MSWRCLSGRCCRLCCGGIALRVLRVGESAGSGGTTRPRGGRPAPCRGSNASNCPFAELCRRCLRGTCRRTAFRPCGSTSRSLGGPKPKRFSSGRRDPHRHLQATVLYAAWHKAWAAAGRDDLRIRDLRHPIATMTGAILAELMARLSQSTAAAVLRFQHAAQGRHAEVPRTHPPSTDPPAAAQLQPT